MLVNMDKYEINRIDGEDILIRYNEIKIELDKALKHSDGEWTAQQVVACAIKSPLEFQIFEIKINGDIKAIASTRVINYNNFTALHIITLGGKGVYKDIPGFTKLFEDMIKEYKHIDYLEFTGRKGFAKQLSTVGWTERYVTMRKHLKET